MEFKNLVNGSEEENEKKVLYFNAFTEDLFSWDNDLLNDNNRRLKINLDSIFIKGIEKYGKINEIIDKFQDYTKTRIEPKFDFGSGEVVFILPTGDDDKKEGIKISRGEENIFIWAIFYIMLENIIEELNEQEEKSDNSITKKDIEYEYIYIDDPISSLDDNHVFDVAIDITKLLKKSSNSKVKFIISTHHSLFYNILYNEFSNRKWRKSCYIFSKSDNKYYLKPTKDSPFGYHLLLKDEIQKVIDTGKIERYHFALFRKLLEKTATFLGYKNWSECLVGDDIVKNRDLYSRRINSFSHDKHSDLEAKSLLPHEKETLKLLFTNFIEHFKWNVDKEV